MMRMRGKCISPEWHDTAAEETSVAPFPNWKKKALRKHFRFVYLFIFPLICSRRFSLTFYLSFTFQSSFLSLTHFSPILPLSFPIPLNFSPSFQLSASFPAIYSHNLSFYPYFLTQSPTLFLSSTHLLLNLGLLLLQKIKLKRTVTL